MRTMLKIAVCLAGGMTIVGDGFTQEAIKPGTRGSDPVTRGTGVGPDCAITGL